MFCQKGARGAQGDAGKDGKHGQDAPTLIHMRMTEKSVDMVLSDGTVLEAEVDGFKSMIEQMIERKQLNWLEAEAQQIIDEGGTPLRSFRGQFLYNESYSVGDVVVFNKTLYVARKANRKDFLLDDWRKMHSGGGGGGMGSVQGLIRSSGDVDLSRGLTDGAFLTYNHVTQKFEINYVDTLLANPINPTVPGSDFNVPTTLNVQNYVAAVAGQLEAQISALQSGMQHQEAVIDLLFGPPATPADEGDRYLISNPAVGDWVGHDNQVAEWVSGAWVYQTPTVGDVHYVDSQSISMVWSGTNWVTLARQAKVSYQATAPTGNPLSGDIWVDSSGVTTAGGKLVIKYWDGASWRTESGNRTWVQPTDPALDPKNQVKDGDTWLNTSPIP